MNKKTSLLDQEETIQILDEFMQSAHRGLVDVIEIRHADDPLNTTTQITIRMRELSVIG
jgi:hypothetical protein